MKYDYYKVLINHITNAANAAHYAMLMDLVGKTVIISKPNSRSDINIVLLYQSGMFVAGRYKFLPHSVSSIDNSMGDNWLITLH